MTLVHTFGPYRVTDTVLSAVRDASARTGVDFRYMMAKAATESAFNPHARAATSNATGLYQFINSTWIAMVHNHGDAYGLGAYAPQIVERPEVSARQPGAHRAQVVGQGGGSGGMERGAPAAAAAWRGGLVFHGGLIPGNVAEGSRWSDRRAPPCRAPAIGADGTADEPDFAKIALHARAPPGCAKRRNPGRPGLSCLRPVI